MVKAQPLDFLLYVEPRYWPGLWWRRSPRAVLTWLMVEAPPLDFFLYAVPVLTWLMVESPWTSSLCRTDLAYGGGAALRLHLYAVHIPDVGRVAEDGVPAHRLV